MSEIDVDFAVSEHSNAVVVTVSGELDDFQAPKLHHLFVSDILPRQKSVVIDLSQVSFVDSVGLGAVVSQAKSIHKSGHKFALVVGSPQVQRLVTQSGLQQSKGLPIILSATCDEALDNLK